MRVRVYRKLETRNHTRPQQFRPAPAPAKKTHPQHLSVTRNRTLALESSTGDPHPSKRPARLGLLVGLCMPIQADCVCTQPNTVNLTIVTLFVYTVCLYALCAQSYSHSRTVKRALNIDTQSQSHTVTQSQSQIYDGGCLSLRFLCLCVHTNTVTHTHYMQL